MIKVIILLLSIYGSLLYASKSCYSVELWSLYAKNFNAIDKKQSNNKTDTCSLLHIGDYYAMRCGCYKSIGEITTLNEYRRKYKNAYIVKTLKYRFKKRAKKESLTLFKHKPFIEEYNFYPLSINLTPHLSEAKLSTNNDLPKLIDKLSLNTKEQMQQIQNNSNLFGLSIQGKYDQYESQHYLGRKYTDYEYNVKLKYDIFKNGYFQHQTKKQENLEQTVIQHYQDLINLQQYNYNTNLNRLNVLLNKINTRYYNALIGMYEDAIKRKKKLLAFGMATKYEVDELIHMKDTFLSLKKVYQEKKEVTIDRSVYEMLLMVDSIKLIPLQTIQRLSKENNSEILMQNAKSDFVTTENSSPYNEITLNVYTSLRAMDEVGSYVTVGAELNLPINFSYSESKRLHALKIRGYNIKKEAVKKYLTSSLKNLYKEFYTQQKLIATDKNSIKNLHLELNNYKMIAMYNIPDLQVNYEQKIFATQNSIVDFQYKIVLKRINMLKILMNISYFSNIYDIKKLVIKR